MVKFRLSKPIFHVPHVLLVLLVLTGLANLCAREVFVPEGLGPWKRWVTDKHPNLPCPTHSEGQPVCIAFNSLKLDLNQKSGTFLQTVTVYGNQWVTLPGSATAWPREARDGIKQIPVVLQQGLPQVWLEHGDHTLAGEFSWFECPPALQVPANMALLSLTLKGRDIPILEIEGSTNLQLGARIQKDSISDASPLNLRVYRKLVDGIPIRLETFVKISVSGRDREIVTGLLLPPNSTVLSIESNLPLRVDSDGKLRAQIHSGEHSLKVVSRFLTPVDAVNMVRLDSLWPEEETWSFEAQRDLRIVDMSGARLIDPSQSGLPTEWMSLPAYRLVPGDTLRIKEKQRGNLAPSPNTLSLERRMWLDFNGKGFTTHDNLTGKLPLRSRLEMENGFELGRAEVDGNPMMITTLQGRSGVEIASGMLNMVSLNRFTIGDAPLPATGWNQDFQKTQTDLHLPPGWKLIHAIGPDKVSNSWITDWSLWDVFLLCILTLSVLRLAGWPVASLAFFCFIFISQEDGLSSLLWLNLLAAIGICKVIPIGRLKRAFDFYRLVSFILMLAIWLPFAIVHARKAIYTQLDGPGSSAFRNANTSLVRGLEGYHYSNSGVMKTISPQSASTDETAMVENPVNFETSPIGESKSKRDVGNAYGSMESPNPSPRRSFSNNLTKVQSGPGEPKWSWESSSFSWSGPVQANEKLHLILLHPWLTRALRALQALLPGALLLLLAFPAGFKSSLGGLGGLGYRGGTAKSASTLLLVFLLSATQVQADFPPDSLLKELEARLLAGPACAPQCASLNSGRIILTGDRASFVLIFDIADTALAILPKTGEGQFVLESIRTGTQVSKTATKLANGTLAVILPRGRHAVTFTGKVLGPRLEINFGIESHNLSVQALEYSVQGLTEGRTENGVLVLQRREGTAASHHGPSLTPDPILPFVMVERTLILDQEWSLETRVLRLAPEAGAFTLDIPLLSFEHPVTSGMAQSKGSALITLQEGESETSWRSVVDRAEVLKLTAGALDQRVETWSVEASSRWHVETLGLPPVLPKDGFGQPTWRPLPGDSLAIFISEPEASLGSVKTIEMAQLTLTPGKRESAASLELKIRAGQGDITKVTLPPNATLEKLFIDDVEQPLTQRSGSLALPLHPGTQSIHLKWKTPEGMRFFQKTPQVVIAEEAVNISLLINVPADRWTLWVGGDAIGPALLLWGVLTVLLGIAFLLGRAAITPLGFLDWFLLFMGTSMINIYSTAPLLALFLALRYREKRVATWLATWSSNRHNLMQISLALLALVAFGFILASVPQGLLSAPDMQVTGNGSHAGTLVWFLDRFQGAFPTGWMISLPIWAYRMAMLVWSLWLAWRLLQWLRWSWEKFSLGGFWRNEIKKKAPKNPPSPKDQA